MAVPFLDLSVQHGKLREELDAAVARVVDSNRFILGEEVEALEREVAAFMGSRHAVGCASGTDALLLSLRALGLGAGDEVIVPSFTFFATAGAVWNAGLRPVFADIDPASFNLTAATIEEALTERTRAVVVVHLYGQMAPMEPILSLARDHGLTVIEDAAQAFGARQEIAGRMRRAGSLGRIGCFSFFPTKILGGFGDGGMVVTDDDDLAEAVAKLRVHGGRKMYHHEMVGTNSRLDALQAAVLRVKLPHVESWLEDRRRVATRYEEELGAAPGGLGLPVAAAGNEHAFNVYTVRAPERDALEGALDEAGIGSSIYYPVPLHLQGCFAGLGYREGDLPVSEAAASEVLSLPIFPEMTRAQVREVSEAVRPAGVQTRHPA